MSEWFDGARCCTRCRGWKPESDFRANPHLREGLDSWCRECHVVATRAWRERNRDYIDARNSRPPRRVRRGARLARAPVRERGVRQELYAVAAGRENRGRFGARSRRRARP